MISEIKTLQNFLKKSVLDTTCIVVINRFKMSNNTALRGGKFEPGGYITYSIDEAFLQEFRVILRQILENFEEAFPRY